MFSGHIVRHFIGECIQISEGDPRLQVLAGFVQGAELLIGCHHVLVAVFLTLFALVIGNCGGKIAGPVEVDVPVDLLAIQFSEVRGVLLRYVRI